jgi:WD40 repeat protein
MVLIGLTSTTNSEEVCSPVVSFFFQPKEVTIFVSGSRQEEKSNILAKVKFVFGSDPVVEKLPVPKLGPAKDHADALSIRDLKITTKGHINLLVGTFKPKIMSFDGKDWTTIVDNIDGWGLQNNTTAGGFDVDENGNFFLPGMWIVGSRTGIYKTSPDGKKFTLFENGLEPIDLCFRDGIIYAVEDKQESTKAILLDAKTDALKWEVPLQKGDHRGVAAAKDGSMFIADWSGLITHISPNGKIIAQTIVKVDKERDRVQRPIRLSDIDLSPDGQYLAIGSFNGYVGIISVDLKNQNLVQLGPLSFNTFVAWPPLK